MKLRRETTEVRRLLRHLGNPRELQRNALVGHLFQNAAPRAAATHVRSLVLRALDRIVMDGAPPSRSQERDRRLHAIVAQCDLGGQKHESVAASLGLSLRQFYRDRTEACARLADAIDAELRHERAHQEPPSDKFSLRLLVDSLEAAGRFDTAIAMLERMLEERPCDLWCRTAIYGRIATLHCEGGQVREATAALERASNELRMVPADSEDYALAQADFLMSRLRVDGMSLGYSLDESSAEHLMSLVEMPARAGLESAVDLYLRVATTYATTRREAGAYGDAIRVLERTRDLIGPHLRPIARAELLEDLGFNYLATQTHVGQSTETTLELLNHAQRHGLTRQAMAAQIDLCTIHMVGGDLPGGIRWGRKALAIAEPVASKSDFHGMLRAVAHVEAIGGNGPEAMSLIERARKLGMQSAPQLRLLQLSQASAHMALGEYESAIACARSARDGFVRLGMTRYLGATHRIEAEALAELGRFAEARVEIATALELTERTASAFILAMTYETSAKITGNPRHDDNAKDIFGSLRAQFNTRMA